MIHLVKLCVGIETVSELEAWQSRPDAPDEPRHVTRMWPKREAEILDGGSLYWVIKGLVLCRQRVLHLDEVIGSDGVRRCGIVMERKLHRTTPAPRRPFQGWRYLPAMDAPADLTESRGDDDALPVELASALADIGVR